jgi:hypothetical protein
MHTSRVTLWCTHKSNVSVYSKSMLLTATAPQLLLSGVVGTVPAVLQAVIRVCASGAACLA